MKKKNLVKKSLVILSTLIYVATYGQKEFAPLGATWYYSNVENFAGDEGYIKIVSERDTTIDKKQSKILSLKHFSSDGDSSILNNLYIYQNGDTINYWIDNAFRVLYNFSLEQGDTMTIYSKELFCPDNESHIGEIKVDTVVNVLINGIELKKIITTNVKGSVYKYPGPFVEIIGGLNGIHPVDSGCTADVFPEIGELRCYFDAFIGYYQVPNRLACESLVTTINPIVNHLDVNIAYLFEAKTFRVELNNLNLSNNSFLKVYDINGKIIYINKINSKYNKINIPINKTGIYILQIVNDQNIMYNEKISAY